MRPSRACVRRFSLHGSLFGGSFSTDGRYLISADQKGMAHIVYWSNPGKRILLRTRSHVFARRGR